MSVPMNKNLIHHLSEFDKNYDNESIPENLDRISKDITKNFILSDHTNKLTDINSLSGSESDSEANRSNYGVGESESDLDMAYNFGNNHEPAHTKTTKTIPHNMTNPKNWSPTKTIETVVNNNGKDVRNDVYQVMVSEMVRDKCWNEKEYLEFAKSMNLIKKLTDNMSSDERLKLLFDPVYYGAIHDAIDKLDTINAMCIFGTGNKCEMINNPKFKNVMKQNVMLIGKIVDIYAPIFMKIILLTERYAKELSDPKTCNLDPEYLNTIKKLKEMMSGSLYMRNLKRNNTQDASSIQRSSGKLSSSIQGSSSSVHKINGLQESSSVQKNKIQNENFYPFNPVIESSNDACFQTVVYVLIIIIIVYIVFCY
jgi:hypothetical protein